MIGTERKTVELFLSFAGDDRAAAEDLWGKLREALQTSGSYEWRLWAFTEQLMVGDDFELEIQKAIAAADVGIFALSSAFLNSDFIRTKELPPFLAPADGKRIAPVLLESVTANADLRGLQGRQVFGYGDPYWSGRRPHERRAWARRLADELHRLAHKHDLGR